MEGAVAAMMGGGEAAGGRQAMTLMTPLALLLVLVLAEPACATNDSGPQPAQQGKQEKKKKESEPAPGPGDSPETMERARREVRRVMRDFFHGFEGSSPRRVMETLDERFEDLPRFEDQVTEFLRQSAEMRVNFRESSSEVKGDRAVVTVDAEMSYATKDAPQRPLRRRQRIQFDFQRTDKGWRIFEISPRSFFTPEGGR
jgi:hypothetical protein